MWSKHKQTKGNCFILISWENFESTTTENRKKKHKKTDREKSLESIYKEISDWKPEKVFVQFSLSWSFFFSLVSFSRYDCLATALFLLRWAFSTSSTSSSTSFVQLRLGSPDKSESAIILMIFFLVIFSHVIDDILHSIHINFFCCCCVWWDNRFCR